jgi:hypothetical protein
MGHCWYTGACSASIACGTAYGYTTGAGDWYCAQCAWAGDGNGNAGDGVVYGLGCDTRLA